MKVKVDGIVIVTRAVGPPFIVNIFDPIIVSPEVNITSLREEHKTNDASPDHLEGYNNYYKIYS